MLHSLGAHPVLNGKPGFHAVLQQGVIAQAGKTHGRQCSFAAHTVRGAGRLAGARLKICGQRVTHPRHQQAHRGCRHHGGVHQHHVWVCRQEQIFFKHTLIRVNDAERRAGRVRRGNGGHDDHRRTGIIGNSLGGVVYLAAADAHYNVAARCLKRRFHSLYLRHAALTAECLIHQCGALLCSTGRKVCLHTALTGGACQHKQLFAQQFHMPAQVFQFTSPLYIARGACHDICHS